MPITNLPHIKNFIVCGAGGRPGCCSARGSALVPDRRYARRAIVFAIDEEPDRLCGRPSRESVAFCAIVFPGCLMRPRLRFPLDAGIPMPPATARIKDYWWMSVPLNKMA